MHSKQLKRIQKNIIVAIVLVVVFLLQMLTHPEEGLDKYFFDIGQGDASMIVLPDDVQMLIDGGPGEKILNKLGSYLPFYDGTIEYMVLTHAHSDHMDGLVEVAKRYSVSTFIFNGIEDGAEVLLEELAKQDTKVISVQNKQSISISDEVMFEVLFPDRRLTPIEYEDKNDSSIVGRLVFGDMKILYTGDSPKEVENYLIDNSENLTSDILKIGHHGSKTSTDISFISTVNPTFAVISVGKNSYGHPHARTLLTLRRAFVTILRTDQEGDIVFHTDGEYIERRNP